MSRDQDAQRPKKCIWDMSDTFLEKLLKIIFFDGLTVFHYSLTAKSFRDFHFLPSRLFVLECHYMGHIAKWRSLKVGILWAPYVP